MLTDFCEPEEYDDWIEALTHTHQRRIRVRVLNLNHNRVASLDDVIDGQVTIDVDEDVTRVANVTLLDPSRSLGMEPDTPSSLPVHLKRMVQIFDDRAVPGVGWISCPLFCGPVEEVDRDGAEVSILAKGKEKLALGSFGRSYTWAKKRKVTSVIAEILEIAGEKASFIHLPDIAATLPKEFNVSRTDKPWIQARKLARSVDRELFYDGRGHVQMRKQPTGAASLLLDRNWLTGQVRIDRPKFEFHNRWIVLGKKPTGDKPRISADVWLPGTNVFSGPQLGRNGHPRWLVMEVERPNVATKAAALVIAKRLRDERIRFAADISLDCLPFPNVEEWDLLKAKDPLTGNCLVRVKKATIPLVAGSQTIGAVKRVSRIKRGYHPASHGGL